MPIYEYRCTDCGAEFPRLQSMNATSEGVSCPKCGSESVERKLSTFASSSSSSDSAVGSGAGCGGSGFS